MYYNPTGLTDEQFKAQIQDAQFILKLKAGHNLSQAAIQEIMVSTSALVTERIAAVKDRLINALQPEFLQQLNLDNLLHESPFQGLETEHMQEKFICDYLGFIKPVCIKLGEANKLCKVRGEYQYIPCEVTGYCIPFLEQLKQLLTMPEVEMCLSTEKQDSFELSDFSDGIYMQNNYFVHHPKALLFSLYNDDFEIANPIGAHKKKHKLSVFYWTLLNIHPEFRFKLQSTQLLAVAKTCHVKKYGITVLLKDFIDGIKKLHSGYEIMINGTMKLFHGTLLCVMGDTPAAQALGGFKEGVGLAEKPCRSCEVKHSELDKSLAGDSFPLRDETEHRDRCDNLEAEGLSKITKNYWSKTYGVVSKSVLLSIPDFCVTKCILHDPMHVLLEGIVKMEIQLMLKEFIDKKSYFSLKYLNNVISNFNYAPDVLIDKPQPLERKSLEMKNVLPMTAIETLNFMNLLPFLIGEKVANEDAMWKNFLRLMQITRLIVSPVASTHTIDCLTQLIFSHNSDFKVLYPNVNFTPKLHYLTHFPDQIKQFGAGRNHWCVRFEAKHGLLKNKKWKNFKNIARSVALYHQRWMCLQQTGMLQARSEIYLYSGDKVKDGTTAPIETIPAQMREKMTQSEPDLPDQVLCTRAVTIKDITYRVGSVLLLNTSSSLITVVDCKNVNLKTSSEEAPRLVLVKAAGVISSAYVVGDTMEMTVDKSITKALLSLMYCYYVWDLSYPKRYQLLGYIQTHILEDSVPFYKGSKLIKFEKMMATNL